MVISPNDKVSPTSKNLTKCRDSEKFRQNLLCILSPNAIRRYHCKPANNPIIDKQPEFLIIGPFIPVIIVFKRNWNKRSPPTQIKQTYSFNKCPSLVRDPTFNSLPIYY